MEHAPTWLTYGLMLSAAVLAVPLAKRWGWAPSLATGGGYCHWPVGPGAGEQCARHPALCRGLAWCSCSFGGAGAATQPPVGHAPPHLRHRQRAGAGLRGRAVCGRLAGQAALAHQPGGGAGAGAVVHRHCATGAGRTQPHAHQRRAGGLSILLFQDVAAIPILALLPLLGTAAGPATTIQQARCCWRP